LELLKSWSYLNVNSCCKQMNKIRTILLVDDDFITNFINKKLLDRLNIAEEVKIVVNGPQGLNCLEGSCFKTKKNPEIIFLDINMPGMDGFDFVRNFNASNFQNKDKVKICVLTTSTNHADFERMEELGVKYFLNKPLTKEKVEEFLRRVEGELAG